MERWRDGEMERWRDGEMERWRDGEMCAARVEEKDRGIGVETATEREWDGM
jgi:hypothetical protein